RADLLLYVSSGCKALLEVDEITLQADPQLLWRVIHPDDRELVILAMQKAATNAANWIQDWRIITPSGQLKWVSGTAHPDLLPDGAILWFGYMVDVSDRYAVQEEREQAEAKTKAQQQIYKAILDNVPHRVWYKDVDSRYIAVNEAFCRAINLTPEHLIGKSEYEVWPLEQAQMFIETDQAAIASGKPYYMERCIPLADGSYHWVMTIKTPVYDDAGNVLGTTGISMDITPRKQAELTVQQLNTELEARVYERTAALQNALSESQALNAILDNLVDGLLVTNTQGRIIRYNPAFVDMFALGSQDFLHQDCQQLALPDLANLIDQLQQIAAGYNLVDGSPSIVDRLGTANNHVVTAEVALRSNRVGQAVASLIFKQTADGDAIQWLGCAVLIRDVTHEREVDRVKNEFIATVSHELRTPLTSVLGFTSIIRDKLHEQVFPLVQSICNQTPTDETRVASVSSTADYNPRPPSPLDLLHTTLCKIDGNLAIIVSEAERLTLL
ncbi:MAG: PAS domain-containing protein, partial [Cyanobacteria bacterium]|nr:PAS domain-containing protein [Cyanobacteriota bacterium]MDW8203288.1 PAS domain-containing protein [Cyanobacteriota bacterium SKYGB_h_bin112]